LVRTLVNSSEWRSSVPETMQPPETREDGVAAALVLVVHELGRRGQLGW
jgi:hypothetical protein